MNHWNSHFKVKQKPYAIKKSALAKIGKSNSSQTKVRIQTLLREIVILRDGGCILRKLRLCDGEIGRAILQADHLITRANSATYGDSRLVVCLCRNCHGGFKQFHKEEYDALVKSILPGWRVRLWNLKVSDMHRPQKMDWFLVELSLQNELKEFQNKV